MGEKKDQTLRFKRPVCFLIGGVHFGHQNVGDEAILEGVITVLRNICPDCKITVLTDKPDRTSQLYNVKTRFRQFNVNGRGRLRRLLRVICRILENFLDAYMVSRHDVIVCAGGTILSDSPATSIRLASLGVGLNKRLIYFPGGMNSGNTPEILSRLVRLSREFDLFLTRDVDSRQRLIESGCDPQHIVATADPAFNLENWENEQVAIEQIPWLDRGKPVVAIGISSEPDCAHHNHAGHWARIADYVVKSLGAYVLFLPSNTEPDKDLLIMKKAHASMTYKDKAVVLGEELRPTMMIALMAHLEMVISSRMHQLIFSAMSTTPFVGISRCDKTDSFLSLFDMNAASSTQNCTLERVQPVLETIWSKKEKIKVRIKSVTETIYAKSQGTELLVKECLRNINKSLPPERSVNTRLRYLWLAFFMRLGKGKK